MSRKIKLKNKKYNFKQKLYIVYKNYKLSDIIIFLENDNYEVKNLHNIKKLVLNIFVSKNVIIKLFNKLKKQENERN